MKPLEIAKILKVLDILNLQILMQMKNWVEFLILSDKFDVTIVGT